MSKIGTAYVEVAPDFSKFGTRLPTSVTSRFSSYSRQLSGATGQTGKLDKATHSLGGRLASAAKFAAGAAAAYLSISQAKAAVSVTQDITKSTIGLHKNLGIANREASQWAALANARGVDTTKLGMAFKTTATQVEAAANGSASAKQLFADLGITTDDVKRGQTDLHFILGKVADGLKNVGAGTTRTNAEAKLFGRGWATIAPLLRDGSAAMDQQLASTKAYGAELSGPTLKAQENLRASTLESKLAWLGMQVTFTKAVTPALIGANEQFQRIARTMADPNLTNDEKFSRIATILEHDFTKALDVFVGLIPHVASQVGHAAPKIAEGLISGFLNADGWGKLALGAWLITKLGITRGVLSGIGSRIAAGVAGGAAASTVGADMFGIGRAGRAAETEARTVGSSAGGSFLRGWGGVLLGAAGVAFIGAEAIADPKGLQEHLAELTGQKVGKSLIASLATSAQDEFPHLIQVVKQGNANLIAQSVEAAGGHLTTRRFIADIPDAASRLHVLAKGFREAAAGAREAGDSIDAGKYRHLADAAAKARDHINSIPAALNRVREILSHPDALSTEPLDAITRRLEQMSPDARKATERMLTTMAATFRDKGKITQAQYERFMGAIHLADFKATGKVKGDWRDMFASLGDRTKSSAKTIENAYGTQWNHLLATTRDKGGQVAETASKRFHDAAAAADKQGQATYGSWAGWLDKTADSSGSSSGKIASRTDRDTKHAAKAGDTHGKQLLLNFGGSVLTLAQEVGVGMGNIGENTSSILKALGVKKTINFVVKALTGKGGGGKARGGLAGVVPGVADGDRHALSLNGQKIADVESEEGVYVVNRVAQKRLETWNAAYPRWGSPAPGMQTGGVAKLAAGGQPNFGGHPTDVVPAVAQAISILQQHFPALAVTATTDGTHVAGSYHYQGKAVDLASASYPYMDRAANYVKTSGMYRSLLEGIHNPNLAVSDGKIYPGAGPFGAVWAAHANHIHLALDQLGKISGGVGATARKIKRQLLTGPPGALTDSGQAALDKAYAAANSFIAQNAPAPGAGGSAGAGPIQAPPKSLPPSLKAYDRTYPSAVYPSAAWSNLFQMPFNKVAELAEWAGQGAVPGVTMAQVSLGEGDLKPGSESTDGGYGMWGYTPSAAGIWLGHSGPDAHNPIIDSQIMAAMYRANPGGAPPSSATWHGIGRVTDPSAHYTGPMKARGGLVAQLAAGGPVPDIGGPGGSGGHRGAHSASYWLHNYPSFALWMKANHERRNLLTRAVWQEDIARYAGYHHVDYDAMLNANPPYDESKGSWWHKWGLGASKAAPDAGAEPDQGKRREPHAHPLRDFLGGIKRIRKPKNMRAALAAFERRYADLDLPPWLIDTIVSRNADATRADDMYSSAISFDSTGQKPFGGHTAGEWLSTEFGDLAPLRNSLLTAGGYVETGIEQGEGMLAGFARKVKALIKRLRDEEKNAAAVRAMRERLQANIEKARKALGSSSDTGDTTDFGKLNKAKTALGDDQTALKAETDKPKGKQNAGKIKSLQAKIAADKKAITDRQGAIDADHQQIAELAKKLEALGIALPPSVFRAKEVPIAREIAAITGRDVPIDIGTDSKLTVPAVGRSLTQAVKDHLSKLRAGDVGGIGTISDLLQSVQGFGPRETIATADYPTDGASLVDYLAAKGIGGQMFTVAGELKDLAGQLVAGGGGGPDSERLLEIQKQLTLEANQRFLVSQAQYGVIPSAFSSENYLGAFARGGIAPRAGWLIAGETGEAEALRVPGGTQVSSPSQTRTMIAEGADPAFAVIVEDGAVDARRIRVLSGDEARGAIRRAGGANRPPLPGKRGFGG